VAARVLITAASKYGTTKEMAGTIGEVMRGRGLSVDVLDLDEVGDISQYDAVIAGSAVYLGRWMTMAREFLNANQTKLVRIPVWLFSAGPIADHGGQVDAEELRELVEAREHKIFRGSIARRNLSIAERLLVMKLGANDGDYRDWVEIRTWADDVARDLTSRPAPV